MKREDWRSSSFSKSILSAINDRKLILFIGAGPSTLCGLPTWRQLANTLYQIAQTRGYFSQKEAAKMATLSSEELITKVKQVFAREDKLDEFYALFSETLTLSDKTRNNDAFSRYTNFVRTATSLVLTTNADEILANEVYRDSRNLFYDVKDVGSWNLPQENDPVLIQLHGSIRNPNSLVFTKEEYLARYKDPNFQDYLQKLFDSDCTILFLGYSLKDAEMLDYLKSGGPQKRYALLARGGQEEASYQEAAKTFPALGVVPVAYDVGDENDYSRLLAVLGGLKDLFYCSKQAGDSYERCLKLLCESYSEKKRSVFYRLYASLGPSKESLFDALLETPHGPDWILGISQVDELNLLSPSSWIGSKSAKDPFLFSIPTWPLFLKTLKAAVLHPENSPLFNLADQLAVESLSRYEKDRTHLYNPSLLSSLGVYFLAFPSYYENGCVERWLQSVFGVNPTIFSSFVSRLCHEKETFQSLSDETLFRFLTLFSAFLIEAGEEEDYFASIQSFFDKIYPLLINRIPKECASTILGMAREFEGKSTSFFADSASFYLYPADCEGIDPNCEKIIGQAMKEALQSLSSEKDIRAVYAALPANGPSFEIKARTYLVNVHFPELIGIFLRESNPFNNWDAYCDLRFIEKDHLDYFQSNADATKTWLKWIETATFSGNTFLSVFPNIPRKGAYEPLALIIPEAKAKYDALPNKPNVFPSFDSINTAICVRMGPPDAFGVGRRDRLAAMAPGDGFFEASDPPKGFAVEDYKEGLAVCLSKPGNLLALFEDRRFPSVIPPKLAFLVYKAVEEAWPKGDKNKLFSGFSRFVRYSVIHSAYHPYLYSASALIYFLSFYKWHLSTLWGFLKKILPIERRRLEWPTSSFLKNPIEYFDSNGLCCALHASMAVIFQNDVQRIRKEFFSLVEPILSNPRFSVLSKGVLCFDFFFFLAPTNPHWARKHLSLLFDNYYRGINLSYLLLFYGSKWGTGDEPWIKAILDLPSLERFLKHPDARFPYRDKELIESLVQCDAMDGAPESLKRQVYSTRNSHWVMSAFAALTTIFKAVGTKTSLHLERVAKDICHSRMGFPELPSFDIDRALTAVVLLDNTSSYWALAMKIARHSKWMQLPALETLMKEKAALYHHEILALLTVLARNGFVGGGEDKDINQLKNFAELLWVFPEERKKIVEILRLYFDYNQKGKDLYVFYSSKLIIS